jgi:hypothetical protein
MTAIALLSLRMAHKCIDPGAVALIGNKAHRGKLDNKPDVRG